MWKLELSGEIKSLMRMNHRTNLMHINLGRWSKLIDMTHINRYIIMIYIELFLDEIK